MLNPQVAEELQRSWLTGLSSEHALSRRLVRAIKSVVISDFGCT